MIDPEFLLMLVCPTSRQPLREASAEELARTIAAIADGAAKNRAVKNRGGSPVVAALSAGLVTADGAWLYPVQDGIPILLAAEAIPVP